MNQSEYATYLADSPSEDYTAEQVMSVLRKTAGDSGQRKRSVSNQMMTLRGGRTPRTGILGVETLRTIYERSDLIFACVTTLVQFVLSAEWTIRPKDEDKSKRLKERDPDKYRDQQKRLQWLKEFFTHPSNYEDYDSFVRKLLTDVLVYGDSYFEAVWAEFEYGKLPVEIGVIPADTIELDLDEHGIVESYWQAYNTLNQVEFTLDECFRLCLHPRSWNPYGLSPIEVAYIQITSDLSANQYNADVFSKNNIPPGILTILGVSKAEFQRLTAQLRGVSADNPHNIHVMQAQRSEDGAKKLIEYVPLQQGTNREMQYVELLTNTVNRCCMAYGVSASQIGFTEQVTGGIGSGVAETQVDLTQNKGVAPLLQLVSRSFTRLIETIGWTDLEFGFTQDGTPAQQKEREDDRADLQIGAMTVNEYRAKLGKGAVDWGDLPITPPQGWQPPMSPQQMQQQLMQQQMGMGGGDPNQMAQPSPDMAKSASTQRIVIKL